MNALIAKAREMSDSQVLDAVTMIGGGSVNQDLRMVRAALIEVYSERFGEAEADVLMDRLGM